MKNLLNFFFTILWTIWNHRNGVIFRKHQVNPVDIFEMANEMIPDTYNKNSEFTCLDEFVGSKMQV